jgi:hypothetical protein
MKKILLIIFLSVVITGCLKAQISIGPKMGIDYSRITNLTTSSDERSRSIPGFNFGVAFNFSLGKMISFQPEALILQKGCWDEMVSNKNIYFKMITNYFEIPAIFKFSYGGERFKGIVDAGPYISYWSLGKVIYNYDTQYSEDYNYEFEKENDNRLDAGICCGAGASCNAGPGMIMLTFRYEMGLVNIWKDNDPRNCNSTIGISLAYLFHLKNKKSEN